MFSARGFFILHRGYAERTSGLKKKEICFMDLGSQSKFDFCRSKRRDNDRRREKTRRRKIRKILFHSFFLACSAPFIPFDATLTSR
jgi:hypothetical protein